MFFVLAVALTACLLTQLHVSAANTVPGTNTLVSVNNVDGQGANNSNNTRDISADGNVILFTSYASNLGGASGGLFERNVSAGTTTQVDVSTAGVQGGYGVTSATMSETGRYVVFTTDGTNLIDGTTEPVGQTYLRDTQTNTTSILTVYPGTSTASGYNTGMSQDRDIVTGVSNDGRFVTIESKVLANRQISSSYRTGSYDVLLLDRATGTWKLLNPGGVASGVNVQSQMSCDGSFVVLEQGGLIYLADIRNASSPAVSLLAHSTSYQPQISCNGNYITYWTQNRTDITPTPSGLSSYAHIVRYNRVTGERMYIDSDSAGATYSNLHITIFSSDLSSPVYVPAYQISDAGDAIVAYSGGSYLKHLSDGSGTLEGFVKNGGTYYTNANGFLSANGKYTTYGYNAYTLGLITASSGFNDVIRSATGL